jgi:hypothetical protein
MHRHCGIIVCVLTVIHVWSLFLPVIFHGYSSVILPGSFGWPLSELKPEGFKDVDIIK